MAPDPTPTGSIALPTFGAYRVLPKLGQGGMGAVYLGATTSATATSPSRFYRDGSSVADASGSEDIADYRRAFCQIRHAKCKMGGLSCL